MELDAGGFAVLLAAAVIIGWTLVSLALSAVRDGWRGAAGLLVEWSAAAAADEPESVFLLWLAQAATILLRDLVLLIAAAWALHWMRRPQSQNSTQSPRRAAASPPPSNTSHRKAESRA